MVAYVELNPMKAGLVKKTWDYRWNSVHAIWLGKTAGELSCRKNCFLWPVTGKLTYKNLKAVQALNLNSMGERADLWAVNVLSKKPGVFCKEI